jgi:dihydrofolate synthase / folylpolyglutamate synthase
VNEPLAGCALDRAAARLAQHLDHETRPGGPGPFTLDGMRWLREALGRPDEAYPVVQVAGTKGKGTTCAAVASSLDAAGLRVGLYTSPHLIHMRERIRVGPRCLPDEAWVEALDEVLTLAARAPGPLTWFELVTGAALVAFRAQHVDVAVLEVGLGGRLDATSVTHPEVCAITRIGLDHTALLGPDHAAVAAEKAAILRAGVSAVADPSHPQAVSVVTARAAEVQARLWLVGREVHVDRVAPLPAGDAWRLTARVRTPGGERRIEAPLPAGPLANDLGLAVGVVELLSAKLDRDLARGLEAGLARLRWRGRCDVIPGDPPLVVDGAHEEDSAQALRDAVALRFEGQAPVLLVGMAADKRVEQALAVLGRGCPEVLCTAAPGSPRAETPERLARRAQAAGLEARSAGQLHEALEEGRARARARGLPLLVAGSLHLAGRALELLGQDVDAAWVG